MSVIVDFRISRLEEMEDFGGYIRDKMERVYWSAIVNFRISRL